jgi:iron complex transport system ATP-binding protein
MLLEARRLTLGYDGVAVVRELSLSIEVGEFVAIVGANAAGKSTLLRGLGRLLDPLSGQVCYDGRDARSLRPNDIARRLAFLPQLPDVDVDLTVEELVWRGRTPYRRALRPPTSADAEAVARAIAQADLEELRQRPLRRLSGGERQRAWIGLALAQEPEVLLLDEPTTFLDLRHQLEIMSVLGRLHSTGLTVVTVLHDLALAARFAGRVVALLDGRVVLDGPPADVFDADGLERVFGVPMSLAIDPYTGAAIPVAHEGALPTDSRRGDRVPTRPFS